MQPGGDVTAALVAMLRRPAWHAKASCRRDDVGRWYPEAGASTHVAELRAVCSRCPVRVECQEAGLAEQYGIWGGTAPRERRSMRKRHRAA